MLLYAIAILFALVVGIAAVFFFVLYRRAVNRDGRGARILEKDRASEMVISEVATYKETKAAMSRFKAHLDELGGFLDSISMAIIGDSEQAAALAYQKGVPEARRALVNTRNAAESLLALVEKRPEEKEIGGEVFGGDWDSSKTVFFASPSNRRQAEQLVEYLKRKTNDVRPCIAGFYFALTIPDEQLRISEAAEQIRLVIKHIDDAIMKTVALQKLLA